MVFKNQIIPNLKNVRNYKMHRLAWFKTIIHADIGGGSKIHKPVDLNNLHIYHLGLCGYCPSETMCQHTTRVNWKVTTSPCRYLRNELPDGSLRGPLSHIIGWFPHCPTGEARGGQGSSVTPQEPQGLTHRPARQSRATFECLASAGSR